MVQKNPDNGALRSEVGPAQLGDPTSRTAQQILRENFWLRELLEARLASIEKATELLQQFADRTPTTMDVQHEVAQLREASELRFEGVKTQITERDVTYKQDSANVAIAVKTAFDSAKEVVTKSESQFRELFTGISTSREADRKSLEGVINDIKERLTRIESRTSVTDPAVSAALSELSQGIRAISGSNGSSANGNIGHNNAIYIMAAVGLAAIVVLAFVAFNNNQRIERLQPQARTSAIYAVINAA